jgi:hypothetical protein
MRWATLWVIFSQTRLVTLGSASKKIFLSFQDILGKKIPKFFERSG